MNNQPMQNLPANPQAPERQPPYVDFNNPPFVPGNTVDPQLQPYLPAVSAATALEIQGNMNHSPMGMFMFNLYSRNNYVNESFQQLVIGIMDLILMKMAQRQFPDPSEAAGVIIPTVVGQMRGVLLQRYWNTGLGQYVDQSAVGNAQRAVNDFQQLQQQVQQFKQQRMGGGQQWGQPQQQQWGQPQQQWQQPQQQWQPQQPRAGFSSQPAGNTGLFGGGGGQQWQSQQQQGPEGGPTKMSDRFARAEYRHRPDDEPSPVTQPFTPREEKSVEQSPFPNLAAPQLEPVFESRLRWKPSVEQPYAPAYNPNTHVAYLERRGNDVVIVLKERTAEMMDYDRHELPSVLGAAPKNLDFAKSAEALGRVRQGVQQLLDKKYEETEFEVKDGEAVEAKTKRVVVKEEVIAEWSESTIWTIGLLSRAHYAKDGVLPDVFRVRGTIAEPTVDLKDGREIVKKFGSANSYLELRDLLNESYGKISNELWTAANRKLTKLINRVLSQNLGIPTYNAATDDGVTVDTFANDIESLLEYLRENFGDAVTEVFLSNQKRCIAATFASLDDKIATALGEYLRDGIQFPENGAPVITFLTSHCTMTYLNCNAHELEIELLEPGLASLLTEAQTPELRQLAKATFKDTPEIATYDHHYVRTNDGRIFEMTQGYLNSDSYLITLIK